MPHFIFIQQISVLNILNMLYNLHFFSSKCRLFHNAALFGFCITHVLNTGCAKIWNQLRRQKVNSIHALPSYLHKDLLILPSHLGLGLPSGLFLQVYPTKPLHAYLFSPPTCHMPHPSHPYIKSRISGMLRRRLCWRQQRCYWHFKLLTVVITKKGCDAVLSGKSVSDFQKSWLPPSMGLTL